MGPKTKELSFDEETVEVLEAIESSEEYSDLDDDYEVEYLDESDYL